MPHFLAVQRTITPGPPDGRFPPEAISEINAQRKRVSIDPGSRPAAIIAISRGAEGIRDAPYGACLVFRKCLEFFLDYAQSRMEVYGKTPAWMRIGRLATELRHITTIWIWRGFLPGYELLRPGGPLPVHLRVRAPLRIQSNSPKAVNRAACRIESMRYGTGRGLPLSGRKTRRSKHLSAMDVEPSIGEYLLLRACSQSDTTCQFNPSVPSNTKGIPCHG